MANGSHGRPRKEMAPRTKPPQMKKNKSVREMAKYQCVCCLEDKPEMDFYKATGSRVWNSSGKRAPLCKTCVDALLKEWTERFGEEIALQALCAVLDFPYLKATYQSVIENNPVLSFGLYVKSIPLTFRPQSFVNSLYSGEFGKTEAEVHEDRVVKWSNKDKQNRSFALSTVGYDPFEDMAMTDSDRKYAFNILAVYCDMDGIKEDGHKLQAVIELAQMQVQVHKLNELINNEILQPTADEKKLKSLTETKTKLLSAVSTICVDNNISSNYNERSKLGHNTLGEKMKEMFADGVEGVKVNLFDVKTSAAMKQIADISNKSILDQLSLDANDYTEMLKDQRELLLATTAERDTLSEENRSLKNEIAALMKRAEGGA